MPAQTAPDPVRRDEQPAPAGTGKLGGDPARSQARVAKREGDDPLLDERRELVGHLRSPPLSRAQDLKPVALDLPFPAVVGRAMDTEAATGGGNADSPGEIEQLQPVAEEDVILRHATRSFRLATKRA